MLAEEGTLGLAWLRVCPQPGDTGLEVWGAEMQLDQLVRGAHAASPTAEALTWGAVSPALHATGTGLKTMPVTRLSEDSGGATGPPPLLQLEKLRPTKSENVACSHGMKVWHQA